MTDDIPEGWEPNYEDMAATQEWQEWLEQRPKTSKLICGVGRGRGKVCGRSSGVSGHWVWDRVGEASVVWSPAGPEGVLDPEGNRFLMIRCQHHGLVGDLRERVEDQVGLTKSIPLARRVSNPRGDLRG